MKICVKRLEVFQKMLSIVMYLRENSNEVITNQLGTYDLWEAKTTDSHGYDGKDFMYVSEFDNVDKITTREVKEVWEQYINGSLIFISDDYDALHTSCYFMQSLYKPCIKYTFKELYKDHKVEKYPLLINSAAVLESYFQNSTVQGEDEQYFSVWEHFVRSYCEQNDIMDLHFYSTGDRKSVV